MLLKWKKRDKRTKMIEEPVTFEVSKSSEAGKPAKSTKREKWLGLLGNAKRGTRLRILGLIAILAASQTFLQMGFIGVGAAGSYSCYLMALLVPISLAALLLGKGSGALMGLFSGLVLFVHATFQPLDIYERYFVTPLNSVILFTFVGFVYGVFFALALRNDPPRWRKIIYLGISSFLGSVIASFTFLINLIVDITVGVFVSAVESQGTGKDVDIPTDTIRAISAAGSSSQQVVLDFVLVFVAAIVAVLLIRAYRRNADNMSLLAIFEVKMLVVVILAFLIVSSLAFAVVTVQSENTAVDVMNSDLVYLTKQLEERDERAKRTESLVAEGKLSEEEAASALRGGFLDGYEVGMDGTLVVFYKGVVEESDNPAYPVGKSVEEVMGNTGNDYLSDMAENGTAKIGLYDITWNDQSNLENAADRGATTQIGYSRAVKVGDRTLMIALPSSIVFSSRTTTMFWTSTLVTVLLIVVYFIAANLLEAIVVRSIDRTNKALDKITEGELDTRVEERRSREFASLSKGINTTVDALKGWIGEAERRMEQDLATAKAIQKSALPRTFPPFPEIDVFDIFASMDAAKEVGGDFYDFFLIDDQTLGFLIADVSGKGIPGALFMMTAKTQIENYMSTGMDISQAILSANKHLCATNDAGMFVTVWAATFNWETGEMTYVNAGHNPPLLRHDGKWEWLTKRGGLFLGTFETAKYKSSQLTLQEGDEIVLYTDGVNEAFNIDEEEYGNDRLEAFLEEHSDLHPTDLVHALRADVAKWAEGAEQSDDITLVCLEYGMAPELTGTLTVPATLDHLDEVMDLVANELDKRLCPADVKHKVEVALEELFVNVCRYAYAEEPEPGSVRVSYTYHTNPDAITVELVDQGMPFNPLTLKDPTKPTSIQDAKIGGLGIFMVRKTMDEFAYSYVDGSNVVAFKKAW